MKILNEKELDEWLFERSNMLEHQCDGIKGSIRTSDIPINVAYVDMVTGEIIYGD